MDMKNSNAYLIQLYAQHTFNRDNGKTP